MPRIAAAPAMYEFTAADGARFGMMHRPELGLNTVGIKAWPVGGPWGAFGSLLGGMPNVTQVSVAHDSDRSWISVMVTVSAPARRTSLDEQAVHVARKVSEVIAALADVGVHAVPIAAAEMTTAAEVLR
ncbi:hypothetical protein [Nocardia sp. NPDC059239]|uniref:hypothetical protein n=1 Tax=Nocardia sp. NPDC059239 TaxID=3346785 RepID=UPI0036B42CE2